MRIIANYQEAMAEILQFSQHADRATRDRIAKIKWEVDDAEITAMGEKTEKALKQIGGSAKELEANIKEAFRGMKDIGTEAAYNLRARERGVARSHRVVQRTIIEEEGPARSRDIDRPLEARLRTFSSAGEAARSAGYSEEDALRFGQRKQAARERRVREEDARLAAEESPQAAHEYRVRRQAKSFEVKYGLSEEDANKRAQRLEQEDRARLAAEESPQAAHEYRVQRRAKALIAGGFVGSEEEATRTAQEEDVVKQRRFRERHQRATTEDTTEGLQAERVRRVAKDFQSYGMPQDQALAAAHEHVAAEAQRLTERFRRLREPLGTFQEGLRTIGQGGWRRGTAQIVTGALGGGAMAELIGGFMGGVTSAIALPIAWAIGNALMNIPKFASQEVDWQRYVQSLGARATGPRGSKEWNETTAKLRHFAGQYYLGSGKNEAWGSDAILDMAGQYQEVASRRLVPGDVAGEQDRIRYMEQAALNTMALGLGPNARVQKPGEFMAAMADLKYGDTDKARNALLSQNSWIREAWFKRHENEGPRWVLEGRLASALKTPQTTADNYTRRTGRILAGSREEIEDIIQHEAATSPYVTGEMRHQTEMFRKWPRGGWGMLPDVATLQGKERSYVEQLRGLEDRTDTKTGKIKPSWFDMPGRRLNPPSFEDERKKLRDWAMSEPLGLGLMPKRTQEYHKGLTPQRIAELERLARGEATPSTLYKDSNRKTDLVTPSQYNWTSFAGLAEQMQQMWSGAPVDAMQTAATTLGRIETILAQRLPAGTNGNQVAVQPAVAAP